MRKILIALVVLAAGVVLFLSLRHSDPSPASPFIGHTFAFQYYPADPKDAGQKQMANYMNGFNFSAQFVNDSTFILRSNDQVTNAGWKVFGDSINIGGMNYLLTTTGQSFLLLSDKSRLELLPLR